VKDVFPYQKWCSIFSNSFCFSQCSVELGRRSICSVIYMRTADTKNSPSSWLLSYLILDPQFAYCVHLEFAQSITAFPTSSAQRLPHTKRYPGCCLVCRWHVSSSRDLYSGSAFGHCISDWRQLSPPFYWYTFAGSEAHTSTR